MFFMFKRTVPKKKKLSAPKKKKKGQLSPVIIITRNHFCMYRGKAGFLACYGFNSYIFIYLS